MAFSMAGRCTQSGGDRRRYGENLKILVATRDKYVVSRFHKPRTEQEKEEFDIQRVEVGRRGIVGYDQRSRREGKRRGERTYKGSTRTFIRFESEGGMRAEAWVLKGGSTAFDAELSALVRGIELFFLRAAPGIHFRIFTDSQAAMRRVLDDRPGPGQQMAIRGIIGAMKTYQRGASISVDWVPGHAGVVGNEIADQWAADAAAREFRISSGVLSNSVRLGPSTSEVSRSFLRATLRHRAISSWGDEIIKRGRGGRPYRVPRAGEVPRIPTALQKVRKELASRFFQLASGHAMIAPFLKEKFGWVESDQCWWCGSGRQSREHLFKECRTWKEQIRKLWKKIGKISGEAGDKTRPRRGGKGFGIGSSGGKVGPGNCSMRRLFSETQFTGAVLEFLEETDVGKVKKGVIVRGEVVE